MSAAIPLFIPCGVIAVASLPFMFSLVPPNRFYGFRTKRTLASPEVWFRANRFAGFALFIASAITAAIFLIHPEYASGRDLLGLAALLVPLLTALVASFDYVRRIGPD